MNANETWQHRGLLRLEIIEDLESSLCRRIPAPCPMPSQMTYRRGITVTPLHLHWEQVVDNTQEQTLALELEEREMMP